MAGAAHTSTSVGLTLDVISRTVPPAVGLGSAQYADADAHGSTTKVEGVMHVDTSTVALAMTCTVDRENVWAALTERDRLSRWFGELAMAPDDARQADITVSGTGEEVSVRILACEPDCRLSLEWTVDDEVSTVTVVLGDAEGGTAVILQEDGVPEQLTDAYRRGWGAHLRRLDAELSGQSMPEWTELAQE
ncbi:MAG TPA: SRPBCC domain-containing protein [Microbacterium sp.]|nr:SRPBCC domain-containing protein [Microbacterium sp.]